MMNREEAGKILAALVICGSNHRSCAECPAYDTEAGRDAQQRACSELLSEENVNTALEIMRGRKKSGMAKQPFPLLNYDLL